MAEIDDAPLTLRARFFAHAGALVVLHAGLVVSLALELRGVASIACAAFSAALAHALVRKLARPLARAHAQLSVALVVCAAIVELRLGFGSFVALALSTLFVPAALARAHKLRALGAVFVVTVLFCALGVALAATIDFALVDPFAWVGSVVVVDVLLAALASAIAHHFASDP